MPPLAATKHRRHCDRLREPLRLRKPDAELRVTCAKPSVLYFFPFFACSSRKPPPNLAEFYRQLLPVALSVCSVSGHDEHLGERPISYSSFPCLLLSNPWLLGTISTNAGELRPLPAMARPCAGLLRPRRAAGRVRLPLLSLPVPLAHRTTSRSAENARAGNLPTIGHGCRRIEVLFWPAPSLSLPSDQISVLYFELDGRERPKPLRCQSC